MCLVVVTTTVAAAAEAAAVATATAEATATGRAGFHRTCFVHDQVTATVVLAMQTLDSSLCFCVAAHFHKAEALGTASVTFHHDLCALNGAEFRERLLEVVVAESVRQVAYVQFVAHGGLLEKNLKRDGALTESRHNVTNLRDANALAHVLSHS